MNPERLHLQLGDCLEELKKLDDGVIDAIVTDPPYGLSELRPSTVSDVLMRWVSGERDAMPTGRGFMGKSWDVFVPPPAVWDECLRVLKPGGHMAVFAGSRTQDLMAMSIRLAGFEIRDTLAWIYGSGFPKSMDVARAIDKQRGEAVKIGKSFNRAGKGDRAKEFDANENVMAHLDYAPISDEARQWDGWGTALKPAIEPIILARKPLAESSIAKNVREHGAGAIHIDACRVGTQEMPKQVSSGVVVSDNASMGDPNTGRVDAGTVTGRFPSNVLLDECAAQEVDAQSGVTKSVRSERGAGKNGDTAAFGAYGTTEDTTRGHTDKGGASRFFPSFKYNAKASKKERPVVEREDGTKIQHPTVKPVSVMSWLVKLLTPENGIVLDPFAGSGSTLQAGYEAGVRAIGIERDPDYARLVHHRLNNLEEK